MQWKTLGRRSLPWFVAIAALSYIFQRVPLSETWAMIRGARLEILAPFILFAVLFWFLIESAAYAKLFSRFNTSLSWREARSLRGLSYLLTPIHLSLGKVGVVLRLAATKHIAPTEAASTLLLYQTVDAIILASLTLIGLSALPHFPIAGEIQFFAAAVVLGLSVYLILIRLDTPKQVYLNRARSWALHRTHRIFMTRDLVLILGVKLAYHLVHVGVFYFGANAFGIELPFAVALAATPIITTIGAMPISPAGLGTQQAAMLYFFSGTGSDAAIVAFGFSLTAAFLAIRCGIGIFYLLRMPESVVAPKTRRRSALLRAAGS